MTQRAADRRPYIRLSTEPVGATIGRPPTRRLPYAETTHRVIARVALPPVAILPTSIRPRRDQPPGRSDQDDTAGGGSPPLHPSFDRTRRGDHRSPANLPTSIRRNNESCHSERASASRRIRNLAMRRIARHKVPQGEADPSTAHLRCSTQDDTRFVGTGLPDGPLGRTRINGKCTENFIFRHGLCLFFARSML